MTSTSSFPFAATPALPEDRLWMARALEMARLAAQRGEVPVGALVVADGRFVSEAHNQTVTGADPTGHAEVVALREAGRARGDWRLTGCTLYVTLEPCTMCAGAIVLSRVERVVYGASDPKAGMVGSLGNLVQDQRLNHRALVTPGVLGDASASLLRAFFVERRQG